jgi:hypothetical protein
MADLRSSPISDPLNLFPYLDIVPYLGVRSIRILQTNFDVNLFFQYNLTILYSHGAEITEKGEVHEVCRFSC